MKRHATTVEDCIQSLPPDRREAISKVRDIVLSNLPSGYEEGMGYGMIVYCIPLSRYPKTYNRQPLTMAALASQKNYMSLYLTTVYGNKEIEEWFLEQYKAGGKKLDMGKSRVRFKKIEDLPLALVGKVIARVPVEEYIKVYEASRQGVRS